MGRLDVFLGVRAAVEPMTAEGRGSIVNISSIDGLMGSPWIISYAASKWAAGGMTKAAAMELASRSRAGELGASRSRAHPSRIGTGQDRSKVVAMIDEHTRRSGPMGPTGEPGKIAEPESFLASDDSSYCNGAEFVAGGGFTAGYGRPGRPTRSEIAQAGGRVAMHRSALAAPADFRSEGLRFEAPAFTFVGVTNSVDSVGPRPSGGALDGGEAPRRHVASPLVRAFDQGPAFRCRLDQANVESGCQRCAWREAA